MTDHIIRPTVVDELREAVCFGYEEDVTAIVRSVKRSDARSPMLETFAYMYEYAIEYNHEGVVRRLAKEGVPITAVALDTAAERGSKSGLALLFELGWDINRRLGPWQPPVLR